LLFASSNIIDYVLLFILNLCNHSISVAKREWLCWMEQYLKRKSVCRRTDEKISFCKYLTLYPLVIIISAHRDSINLAVLSLIENGELAKLKNRWWYDRTECKHGDKQASILSHQLNRCLGQSFLSWFSDFFKFTTLLFVHHSNGIATTHQLMEGFTL